MKKIMYFIIGFISLFAFQLSCHAETFEKKEMLDDYVITVDDKHYPVIVFENQEKRPVYQVKPEQNELESIDNYNIFYNKIHLPLMISEESWEDLEYILYFGYGYENHTDPKWYALTQFLLWKELYPEKQINIKDKNNDILFFQQEIAELENLISAFRKTPSFIKEKIIMHQNTTKTLQDNNQVLDSYTLRSNSFFFDASISKNELTITSFLNNAEEEICFMKYQTDINHYSRLYIGSAYFIEVGIPREINQPIPVIIGAGQLKITLPKNIPEEISNDLYYEIYDQKKNLVDTVYIDKRIGFSNLLAINHFYTVKEKSKKGYFLETNSYRFYLKEDKEIIEFSPIVQPNYFELTINASQNEIEYDIKKESQFFSYQQTNSSLYLPKGKYQIITKSTDLIQSITKEFTLTKDMTLFLEIPKRNPIIKEMIKTEIIEVPIIKEIPKVMYQKQIKTVPIYKTKYQEENTCPFIEQKETRKTPEIIALIISILIGLITIYLIFRIAKK